MEDRDIVLLEGAGAPPKPWRENRSSSKVLERGQGLLYERHVTPPGASFKKGMNTLYLWNITNCQ